MTGEGQAPHSGPAGDPPSRIAFLGFGLIGGSMARALRARRPEWEQVAWSPSGAGPSAAADDGTIDRAAADPASAIAGADLVILAAPPLATLSMLDDLAGPLADSLGPRAAITDVASTKRAIVARAMELGLPFVGGHPMAGSDATSYGAADPDLFVDRPWVIVPGDPAVASRVEELATAVGARPIRLDAVPHDAAVSAISHLPLVLSAALVETVATGRSPEWMDNRQLAAGGWRDMTRLARGDPEMGAGIMVTNADYLAERLRVIRDVLDEWLALIDAGRPDAAAIRARLEAARAAAEEGAS